MKKNIYLLFSLLSFFLLSGCVEKEDLIFEHEKSQFELKSDKILLEVIVPVETAISDEIYIVGEFNGGTSAAGKAEWRLQRSDNTNYRWGVYLDPSKFLNGKTLSDGYYFTNLRAGYEVTLDGEQVLRTETADAGNRLEGKIIRWEDYFVTPGAWPVVPANKIMLRLSVPDYTPEKAQIVLYGNLNGWDGAKWQAIKLSATKYYFLLDPTQFVEGSDLSNGFKTALLQPSREWWYHQANEDGGSADGAEISISQATTGKAYDLTIAAWRNKDDIGTAEEEPITIKIKQVTGNWEEIAVYSWGGDPNVEAFGGWPGTTLTAEANGWYIITIPESRPINLILHNKNGEQFDFIADPSESTCYEIDTDAKSFIIADCPAPDPEGYTIRWKQVEGSWTEIAVYSWGGDPNIEAFGGWPGKVVTPDANGWYSVLVPESRPINMILNNNGGGEQFDFIIDPDSDACYEIDTNSKTFTTTTCP